MKKYYWIVALLVLVIGSQSALAAKLYKWVDEYGNVTYRDTPPLEEGAQYEEKDISGGDASEGQASAASESAPVVIYSTPSCGPCDSARAYLRSRNIPFTDKNVQGNGKLQQELKAKSGAVSVPTILIGEKVMNGYVQSLLASELDAAGYPKAGSEAAATAGEAGEAAAPAEGEPAQSN